MAAKRKLPKVKVSKDTGNTIITVAGLGLVTFFAYKMFANSDTSVNLIGGGYSGSGPDLSGILPFLQETPPVFNISNPEIPSSFFINPSDVLTTTSTTGETVTQTKKEFTTAKVPEKIVGKEKIVGNTSSNLLTNIFNPNYWFGSWGKDLTTEEYTLRQENNTKFALFKNPMDLINYGQNPLGYLVTKFITSNNSGSGGGGGGGGCIGGSCARNNNTSFNIDLTSKKTTSINEYSNFNNAKDFLTSLRSNGVQDRTITYSNITSAVNNPSTLAYATKIQNQLANSLASTNCGPAIAINACSGTKKQVNYSTTQSTGVRYYENTFANTPKELITVESVR